MMFWCDNYISPTELLQRRDIGRNCNTNLKNNSVTSPYINKQTFNDYQSLKNGVTLKPDEAIKQGNCIKQRKQLTTINSCINKGGGRCKIQSDAHPKPSKSVPIRQQSAIKKGDNSFVNGKNDNVTPTIILRYQHKSRDLPFNPFFKTNGSLTNPEHSFDSVDFVFQANRPEDLKLPSLNSLSPEVKQQSRNLETKKKEDNYGSFPRDHSWMQWDISNDSGKLHSIPEQESDVLSFMRSKSYSNSESFESTSTTVSKKLNVDILCSDIYKRAYVAALKYARVRHFQHVPFESIVTNPFVFSYFDLLCTSQRRKSNFAKKFDEMELIFGTVKIDDFIIK